jgi:hypothetical protein
VDCLRLDLILLGSLNGGSTGFSRGVFALLCECGIVTDTVTVTVEDGAVDSDAMSKGVHVPAFCFPFQASQTVGQSVAGEQAGSPVFCLEHQLISVVGNRLDFLARIPNQVE